MAQYVREPYPARAAVGVAGLPRGALVEIDAHPAPRGRRARAQVSRSSGCARSFDLVLHLPLRYEDETALTAPAAGAAGQAGAGRGEGGARRGGVPPAPPARRARRGPGAALPQLLPQPAEAVQRAAEDGQAGARLRRGARRASSAPRWCIRATASCGEGEPLPRGADAGLSRPPRAAQTELRALILEALDAGPLEDTLPAALRRRYRPRRLRRERALLHRPPPGIDVAALADRTPPGVAAHEVRRAARAAALDALRLPPAPRAQRAAAARRRARC